jgi:Fe-S cluster assembly protein SufD
MNAITSGAGFLARYEGLLNRLPGRDLPWLAQLRADCAELLRAQGLPTRRVEAWRYTDLAPIAQEAFSEALTLAEERRAAAHACGAPGRLRGWPFRAGPVVAAGLGSISRGAASRCAGSGVGGRAARHRA